MNIFYNTMTVLSTISGRLRFVNIEKTDDKGGKAYACYAFNYFMGKDVLGPDHYIEVLGCKCTLKRPSSYKTFISCSTQLIMKF